MPPSKGSPQQNGKLLEASSPVTIDYESKFSKMGSLLQSPALRKTAVYMVRSGYIKMAGGFPNPITFPMVGADFKLRDGSTLHVNEKQMEQHLQYGLSEGYPELRQWLIEFQCKLHSPLTLDPKHPGKFDLIITCGSNQGLSMAFNVLLSEGDWMLTDAATYSTALTMAIPIGSKCQAVQSDDEGMVAEDLERVLTSWDDLHPGAPKPKVLYAITSGGNPTGVTWSERRKRAVYALARQHDLMIVEDDAYYFLQFSRPLVPSFLSMDLDGRVVRLDTFSKLIGPGLRVAMASGPTPVLRKMGLIGDISSVGTSGLSQVMVMQLLRHWGHDGFLRHVDANMEIYKKRAMMAAQSAKQHLSGLAEWNTPSGGMFLWLRVLGVKDTEAIVQRALEDRVIMVSGRCFMPSQTTSAYIRVSFGIATQEECDKAFTVLAGAIKEELAKEP